jgi:hypothetical protein
MRLILVFSVLAVVPYAFGQSGGSYVLEWSTIDDGGGGTSSGGPYVLTGTIGQPDAGWSEGGQYELLGGLWPGGPLCFVEFDDFARFAMYWRDSGSDLPADLYKDEFDTVNWKDLDEFVYWWLYDCPYNWPLK